MSITVNGSTGLVFSDNTTQSTAATGFGFKNRIINGDMRIDQRNAGASVDTTVVGGIGYSIDRFGYTTSQASKFTIRQNAGSITPPTGFTNYLGVTSSSAYSVISTDYFTVRQNIEGYNTADLGWGTSNAQSITVSFKVYSSLTGTFGGSICNGSGTRSYPFSYSIPVANTWTTISVTIAGDTTGTWATDNTPGLCVRFSLGAGSTYSGTSSTWQAGNYIQPTGTVSIVGVSGATFYITGVQLEKGSTATAFDYRPYETELALCECPDNLNINALGFTRGINAVSINGGQLAGFRNRIINGDMNVSQRGTSFSSVANGSFTLANGYTLDRWFGLRGGYAANIDISQQAGFSGFSKCMRVQRTSASTSTASLLANQIIESVNISDLAGQAVTLSAYIRAGSNYSGGQVQLQVSTSTSADQTSLTYVAGSWAGLVQQTKLVTITTTGTLYTYTFTVPSNALSLGINFGYTPTGTAGANDYIEITGVQLERGYQATPYEFLPIGTELALCQRYYLSAISFGTQRTAGLADCYCSLSMRATPTITPGLLNIEGTGGPASQSYVSTGSTASFVRIETSFAAAGALGTPCTHPFTASAEI